MQYNDLIEIVATALAEERLRRGGGPALLTENEQVHVNWTARRDAHVMLEALRYHSLKVVPET